MADNFSVSLSDIRSRAIDKLNDFGNNFNYNIQRNQAKKVLIGDLLNGQIPCAGQQTAAQKFDVN